MVTLILFLDVMERIPKKQIGTIVSVLVQQIVKVFVMVLPLKIVKELVMVQQ